MVFPKWLDFKRRALIRHQAFFNARPLATISFNFIEAFGGLAIDRSILLNWLFSTNLTLGDGCINCAAIRRSFLSIERYEPSNNVTNQLSLRLMRSTVSYALRVFPLPTFFVNSTLNTPLINCTLMLALILNGCANVIVVLTL